MVEVLMPNHSKTFIVRPFSETSKKSIEKLICFLLGSCIAPSVIIERTDWITLLEGVEARYSGDICSEIVERVIWFFQESFDIVEDGSRNFDLTVILQSEKHRYPEGLNTSVEELLVFTEIVEEAIDQAEFQTLNFNAFKQEMSRRREQVFLPSFDLPEGDAGDEAVMLLDNDSYPNIKLEGTEEFEIHNFGGIKRGTSPSGDLLLELDTLHFVGDDINTENRSLVMQGDDLIITFETESEPTVVLKWFDFQNLDDLTEDGNIWNMESGNNIVVLGDNDATFWNELDNIAQGLEDSNDSLVRGLDGNSFLNEESSDDTFSRCGGDVLIGNIEDNQLLGDRVDDLLNGGSSSDTYISRDGCDVFILRIGEEEERITDCALEDQLALSNNLNFDDLKRNIQQRLHHLSLSNHNILFGQ